MVVCIGAETDPYWYLFCCCMCDVFQKKPNAQSFQIRSG